MDAYQIIIASTVVRCLINIVSGEENHPEAVLIRGIEGAGGPGKASKKLSINTTYSGLDLCANDEIWLEDDGYVPEYRTDKRVGMIMQVPRTEKGCGDLPRFDFEYEVS